MTPAEMIALARVEFGEANALTISESQARDFLNAALMELYEDVGPARLKNLLTEEAITLTSGKGDIDSTWDKVLEVYVDGTPAIYVARETIEHSDYNEFFSSPVPIFYMDDSHIWVRPTTGVCRVVHLDPPSEVTALNEDTEYTDITKVYHPALADLVASYMYAQEEDTAQSELYRAAYTQKLGMLLAPEPAE